MRFRLPVLAGALVAALALPGGAQAQAAGARSCAGHELAPSPANLAALRATTLCLVNKERRQHGLGTLRSVPALQSAASAYAKRMVRDGFFNHTSPDGGTFVTRIKRTTYLRGGVRRWSVGENLAWGTGARATPGQIVQAWMKSPGHRRNILDPRFTELGMGVAPGAPAGRSGSGSAATYVNEFGMRHR